MTTPLKKKKILTYNYGYMGSETQNFVLVWTLTFLALGERVRGRQEGGGGGRA